MRSDINYFIKSVLKFISFSVLIYFFMVFIWGDFAPYEFKIYSNCGMTSNNQMHIRLSEVKQMKNMDVLFLGSSHAYRGFDTRIFKKSGFKTFNLGSSSQTPIQSRLLLNRYLDIIKPKIIIYEVNPDAFSSDGVESSLDIIANDRNDMESLKMVLLQNHIKSYNAIIYGLYRNVLNKESEYAEKAKNNTEKYISGGFVEKDLTYFKTIKYGNNVWKYNKDQFYVFEKILDLIKQYNIRLILVQAPITSHLYNSYVNNDYFDRKMMEYGDYYNFNEIMKLNDSLYFYDSHHLNQMGVDTFNRKLIDTILTN